MKEINEKKGCKNENLPTGYVEGMYYQSVKKKEKVQNYSKFKYSTNIYITKNFLRKSFLFSLLIFYQNQNIARFLIKIDIILFFK